MPTIQGFLQTLTIDNIQLGRGIKLNKKQKKIISLLLCTNMTGDSKIVPYSIENFKSHDFQIWRSALRAPFMGAKNKNCANKYSI